MFEMLLWLTGGIALLGMIVAFDGSKDVFHPLVFIAPMLIFLYTWMPWRLLAADGLSRFFLDEQLIFVQRLYLLGVLAFVAGCLFAGVRARRTSEPEPLSQEACQRLLIGSVLVGAIGLICWLVQIIEVGGPIRAFSNAYSGGWDDSGYVRDGDLLLLVAVLLAVSALSAGGSQLWSLLSAATFGLPWIFQAILMARRGPTFAIVVIVAMGWYLNRNRRPPLLAMALLGVGVGWLALFLVTNRQSIYLGSDFDVSTNVNQIVTQSDTGNEYIYGAGSVLSSLQRDHYFWMRRYLAQIVVRPIPSSIWPTKYEDFGVPELLQNAGTNVGFGDALGWVGADGSAPGVIADIWVELWWLCLPAIALIGWYYGWVWQKAVSLRGAWAFHYAILSCLSMYLVMQTLEAVIFRTLLLSLPGWLVWKWVQKAPVYLPEIPWIEDSSMNSVRSAYNA
jgi:oligosaccharide repeat unit polymerase